MASTVKYNSLRFLKYPAPLPPSNMLSVSPIARSPSTATSRRRSTATAGRRSTAIQPPFENNEPLFGVVSKNRTILPYNSKSKTLRNSTTSRLTYHRSPTSISTTRNPCNESSTNNEHLFGQQKSNGQYQIFNNNGKPCPPKNNNLTGQPFSIPPPPPQFSGKPFSIPPPPSVCANNLRLDEGNPIHSTMSNNKYYTHNNGKIDLWRYTNQGWKCKQDFFGEVQKYLNQRKKPTWGQRVRKTIKNFKQTIGNKFRTIKK